VIQPFFFHAGQISRIPSAFMQTVASRKSSPPLGLAATKKTLPTYHQKAATTLVDEFMFKNNLKDIRDSKQFRWLMGA
jgi:hypothetical protein